MNERTLLITDNQHVTKTAYIEPTLFRPRSVKNKSGKQSPSTSRIQAALLALLFSTGSATIAEDRVTDTITVTASRLPLSLNQIGAAVTVIDQETIRSQGAQTLADLLLGYPGISGRRQGPHGTLTPVRLRGADANHVLVLIDGVEANDVTQGSEFNFAQFPIDQIERIEITRGPQSALWGSDALAGVIHITTRPRSSNKPRTALTTASAIAMQIESVSSGAIAGTITSLTSVQPLVLSKTEHRSNRQRTRWFVSTHRNARHQIDLRVC